MNLSQLTEAYEYLDNLRESGVTNMFGASRYLQDYFFDDYPISDKIAKRILTSWMNTFDASSCERKSFYYIEYV